MSEWREMPVAAMAITVAGGPFGSSLGRKDYVSEGVPVIRGSQLSTDAPFRMDDLVFVTEEKADRHRGNLAYPGDVIVTQRGTLGQVGIVPSDSPYPRLLLSQSQMKVTVDTSIAHPRFVFYALREPVTRQRLVAHAVTAGVPHINLATLREFTLTIPDLATQSACVEILDWISGLIENNRLRVALLERLARAIYREWFVQFRYPGHEEDELVESSLGPIPSGWEIKSLGDLAAIVMGQSPRSEHYNDLGEGLPFHQGVSNFGSHYPRHRLYCRIDGRMAETNDHLVSVRAPVGRINRADQRMVIGRGLAAVRSNDGFQSLLGQQLRHVFHQEDVMGGGTIFKAITKGDLQGVTIVQPDAEVGSRANALLEPIDSLIQALTFSERRLVDLRDLVLPKLVTGAIDVSQLDLEALDQTAA